MLCASEGDEPFSIDLFLQSSRHNRRLPENESGAGDRGHKILIRL